MKKCTLVKQIVMLLATVVFFNAPVHAKSGDVTVFGAIQSLTPSAITINGTSFVITSDTEVEGENDNRISLSDLSVGDIVKIKIRQNVVHEIELKNSDDSHNGSNGGGSKDDDDSKGDDSKGSKGNETLTKMKTRLTLVGTPGIFVNGWAKYQNSQMTRKNRTEKRLQAKLHLNGTAADYADNLPTLELRRGGTAYALCQFVQDLSDDDDSSSFSGLEFKVDVKYKEKRGNGDLRSKKGSCDSDLATDGIQAGIPDVQDGDTAHAFVGSEEIAQGAF